MGNGAVQLVPANNGAVYAMMGGHGGMGGSGGGGMMGSSQGMSAIWDALTGRSNDQNRDYSDRRQREELREEIRQKRRELRSLLRSDTPDKALIDKKITELDRLEAELDEKTYRSYNRQ